MPASARLIIGLGEILWDMLPAGRQLGGAPANFAYHAAALGAQGAVVSRVGADALGREILGRLDALKVNRVGVGIDSIHPTGMVDVTLDAAGVPQYVIRTDVAWDFLAADEAATNLAARADAICFGSLAQRSTVARESIAAILGAAPPNCLRVFDINLRQHYFSREVIERSLKISDVLKINDQELPAIARLLDFAAGDLSDIVQCLFRQFPLRLIALTRGPEGSALFDRTGTTSEHPAFAGELADTVGAGDAFTAALVLGLLEGHSLPRINAFANQLAGFVCSQHGATPMIPARIKELFSTQ